MAIETKSDVFALIQRNSQVIKGYGVRRIGIFGSFARGESRRDSDLDLLVEFEPSKKTYDNFIGLTYFLEDEVHRKIDLLTEESLSPYIGPHILREVEYCAL